MPRQHHEGCVSPAEVSASPASIEDSVALVNAMPRPLTLPCFLEALARPLQLNATRSEFSAQPAEGERSPRIFVSLGALTFSVVPEGIGASLLEIGEVRAEHRSLKAELHFPVTKEVTPSEPYERVLFSEDLTACAFCHAAEVRDESVPGGNGYVSQALRPRPYERISLDSLRLEHEACDPGAEPDRCALLDALFGWGEVVEFEFPADMDTFGD